MCRSCARRHWFFNYANPMTVNCWAVRQATGANVTGLCHGVMHVERDLAAYAGVPPAEVTSLAVGLNHFTWLFDLRWRGRDLWPLLRARMAQERGQAADIAALHDLYGELPERAVSSFRAADSPFTCSLFETYGAYPAVHDRHVTEFFPRQFGSGSYYGKTLGVDAFSFEGTIAHGDAIYQQMQEQAAGRAPLDDRLFQRAAGEHEQLLDIINAIDSDQRRIFSANLPNGAAVPNLPPEAILELPAAATATGFRQLVITDFPESLAQLLRPKIESQALTVQAALTGSRSLFVDALIADGALAERATAERLADDLLHAHKAHLPQFA